MKPLHGLPGKVLAVAAAFAVAAMAFSARAEKGVNGEAKVIRIKGNVRYSADQKSWKDLKEGKILKSGTLIQTSPGGTVDLCLKEGRRTSGAGIGSEEDADNVIRIFENSLVSIDKLAKEEIQYDLRAGTLMGTVGKLSATARYEIKLPHGFVGVRGGTYIADASGVVNVLEGNVVMVVIGADKSMATKRMGARQGYDPTTGEVVPLHMTFYPPPLTCSGAESSFPGGSSPTSGAPHGSGMGGGLRKF